MELTQAEIDELARSYSFGRIAEWMILDACDDDETLFRRVLARSKDFISSVDDGEAVDGLI